MEGIAALQMTCEKLLENQIMITSGIYLLLGLFVGGLGGLLTGLWIKS